MSDFIDRSIRVFIFIKYLLMFTAGHGVQAVILALWRYRQKIILLKVRMGYGPPRLKESSYLK